MAKLYGDIGEPQGPKTTVTDRELALANAIKAVWPQSCHLLCTWHISNNVLTNCRRIFNTNEIWEEFVSAWNGVWRAATAAATDAEWLKFRRRFAPQWPEAVDYLHTELFLLWRKFFVSGSNDLLHFGNTVTSRVELSHAALKRWLHNGIGDLKSVTERIELVV